MNGVKVIFDGHEYFATYNSQSGYYELELMAPQKGGIYTADISFEDLFGQEHTDTMKIQVLAKEKIKLDFDKVFMWIFDYNDFSVKDIVEISDYEINIDEETNENSIINVLKKTTARARDIVVIKKNNDIMYWGIIQEIINEDGRELYQFSTKYITNLFDLTIELVNQELIKTSGVEDFIADAISRNLINNTDVFLNLSYLKVNVKTHTKKQVSVNNVENNIYNLHTWMTNCTQNYDIVYSFSIENGKLTMNIENKTYVKELIDVAAQNISNYLEVFETDIVSKVIVLTDTDRYVLYLLNDRTTTTNVNAQNRAIGRVETIYTAEYEDARQVALDKMKSNSYNHNITFSLLDEYIKIGTPVAIKTKESLIYDTYISAVRLNGSRLIEYQCGNIRTNFIEKLMKERNKKC